MTSLTGSVGGHLRPDLYGHMATHVERFGVEATTELAEFEISHVYALKEVIEKERIDCDFTLARTIDVWSNQNAAEEARAVYDRMVAYGLKYMNDVHFTIGKAAPGVRSHENRPKWCIYSLKQISGVRNAKACATYTAGMVFPYKFILHLVKTLKERGVNIQTYTPVMSTESNTDGSVGVLTSRGVIKASKVVHATNAYTKALLPEYAKNIIPCKGLCCHIAVPSGQDAPLLNNSYIIREAGDPSVLSYLIPRTDGGIIVGGASQIFRPHLEQWYNNTDDSCLIDSAKDYYENYMQKNFRGWEDSGATVQKIWTGVMGYSFDSLPHVGHVPNRPGQFILGGFNGHGMPIIWLAAKGLADMVHTGKSFEETRLPKLYKTTQERINKAQAGPEGGDILH